ncbi:peptidylprolyl isomerase SurA [Thaumasiovibrio sp. DFM-14]|uniref:peptidylprolyl isomerase SurA n=1 Tax=Thaumasiovibrio sp. DFM-14 TaxID=3384792 RepID=UPI0039A05872
MNNWKQMLIGGLVAATSLTAGAAPQELDRVVTIVNNGVILQSDIDTMLNNINLSAIQAGQSLPSTAVLVEQITEQKIIETLQLQEAERYGIRIDDTRLDATIADIAKENNQSITEWRSTIERSGSSYAAFRQQIRNELTASEARNALVRQRINILPQEVESLAQRISEETLSNVQYNISDIQLRFPDNATKADRDAVLNEANQLVDRINNGENFATLALTYSKGPRALQGGNWGWQRKEEMPTVFADQISTQGAGAIIGPFLSGVGYHILKIDELQGMETVSVMEVNARHILVQTSVILSDEGAERQLLRARDNILSGDTTFADAAASLSADPGSAANNGELGWQMPELYVPEFKQQVEELPIGEISMPFKTVHGWHIVEVIERREVDRTDAAFQNRAYGILFNRKFNEEAQTWLQELKAGAYIEHLGDDDDR